MNATRLRLILLISALSLLVAVMPVLAQTPDENTLIIGQSVDVGALDPASVNSRSEANIFFHVFGTLFEIGDDGVLRPFLATEYAISEDGKEWTFTLNEGMTCHDGEALTAEDRAHMAEIGRKGGIAKGESYLFSTVGRTPKKS